MTIADHLKKYLDHDLLTMYESIRSQFDKTADFILKNCLIVLDESEYHVTEIEFYYYREGIHEDPFVHKHENQLKMGAWYFHDVGQDITFGDGMNYGGILIRGIKDRKTGEFADGPIKVFDKLFNEPKHGIEDRHTFRIQLADNPLTESGHKIYYFPRVGLQPTKDKQGIEYLLAPYRYMAFPEQSTKDRNIIYFYLKYVYDLPEIPPEITRDSATIKYYDDQFNLGWDQYSRETSASPRKGLMVTISRDRS